MIHFYCLLSKGIKVLLYIFYELIGNLGQDSIDIEENTWASPIFWVIFRGICRPV